MAQPRKRFHWKRVFDFRPKLLDLVNRYSQFFLARWLYPKQLITFWCYFSLKFYLYYIFGISHGFFNCHLFVDVIIFNRFQVRHLSVQLVVDDLFFLRIGKFLFFDRRDITNLNMTIIFKPLIILDLTCKIFSLESTEFRFLDRCFFILACISSSKKIPLSSSFILVTHLDALWNNHDDKVLNLFISQYSLTSKNQRIDLIVL